MDALSPRVREARRLFSGLGPTYDRMGAILSFWQDPRWRRFMVSQVAVPQGGSALDVACGTGLVARRLAETTRAGRVVGLDQSAPMVREGMKRAERAALGERLRFVLGDGQRLPFRSESFDAVTFTYLLRYVDDPAETVQELARVLRPGGAMASLEFQVPERRLWHVLWSAYTRVALPVAGRAVSRDWYAVGRFLGPSIAEFVERHPLSEQLAMWRTAGIADVQARVMSLGGGVVIWGSKRGP